jgi:uncharacterized membrane protein YgdD (TMEM256/DUF423 family)
MLRRFVMMGGINLFLSVALGAFGAHALKARISEQMLADWQTGNHYHMIHALGILLVAILADKLTGQEKLVRLTGNLLQWGIVFFSGSLYVLALTGVKILGAVTPIGGVCFLAAWILLVVAASKQPKERV